MKLHARPKRPRVVSPPASVRARVGLWLRRLGLVALAALLVTGGYVSAYYLIEFTHSDFFRIRDIQILGASAELEADALGCVDKYATRAGWNLCRVEVRALRRALGELPRVRHAEVRRKYPGRLCLHLVERTPLMVANLGRPCLIDSTGMVLDEIEPERIRRLGLPMLTCPKTEGLSVGDRIEIPGLAPILEAVEFIREGDPNLYRMIVEWNLDGRGQTTAILHRGTEVRFGDHSPFEVLDKLSAALTAKPELARSTYIDLRMNRQIVYK